MKFLKEAVPYIIILIAVLVVRAFLFTPVIVSGTSMADTLKDGEILILKKYDKSYERFDIVVFNYNNSKLVKRIIGLPGETVEYKDGVLYINGSQVDDPFASKTRDFKLSNLNIDVIPEGYYFVMGDNRNNSSDSRIIGPISLDSIEGTTTFSLWPIGFIE